MRFLTLLAGMILTLPQIASAAQNVTTFRLDNGMEAVVIEDHRAPVVTHMVWYRTGAADEAPGKSGIAHLLEHLLFKGTLYREPGEFSRLVAANGGSENAFTSYDYTGYWQRVAADRLELMMELESDRMRNLVISDEDVATERDVVLEERNTRTENNPGALFSEQRMAALYLNHPYGIPIIGWKHEVSALTRDDALAFYQKYYAPNNAILIVAGDVDPEYVQALAEHYYGQLEPSRGLEPRQRPGEPPQIAERRLLYADTRVSQPYVIRTYLAPERNPGDQKPAAALTLLAELLGGSGLSSVMGQKLQLDDKIAINVAAFYDGLSLDRSGFGLVVVPAEGISLQQAEAAMDKVLAEFLDSGIDADHLDRLKAQILAAEIYAEDSVQGIARRYGEALTSGLGVEDVAEWPSVLHSVTGDDIMRAARALFDRRQSVTGWLMREPAEAEQ
ncbi:MAG: insulinase family protein [Rhodobacteraceae bacterium]|nr:insulinase family protein [Paracoccaceae bacterium]